MGVAEDLGKFIEIVLSKSAHLEDRRTKDGGEVAVIRYLAASGSKTHQHDNRLCLELRLLEVEDNAVGEAHPSKLWRREALSFRYPARLAKILVGPSAGLPVRVLHSRRFCLSSRPCSSHRLRGGRTGRDHGNEGARPGPILLERRPNVLDLEIVHRRVESAQHLGRIGHHFVAQRLLGDLGREIV